MKVVNWVPAFGWEVVFELVGVLCWVGGGLLFFMGHVIRLLIEVEGKTSR